MEIQINKSKIIVVFTLTELEARAIKRLIGNTSVNQRLKQFRLTANEAESLSFMYDVLYQEKSL